MWSACLPGKGEEDERLQRPKVSRGRAVNPRTDRGALQKGPHAELQRHTVEKTSWLTCA